MDKRAEQAPAELSKPGPTYIEKVSKLIKQSPFRKKVSSHWIIKHIIIILLNEYEMVFGIE